MKLWAGRLEGEADSRLDSFNSSIAFDSRMYRQDIGGSIAHATMLGECGIIENGEVAAIIAGLQKILVDLESGALAIDPKAEDIHMFIETVLTERIGSPAKRLHTARSRNDQVALDLRLTLRDDIAEISEALLELVDVLLDTASRHTGTIMPGYTHLQRAQPVTFAHHLLAYGWMLERDISRLRDCGTRMNVCPLGCGALASTTYPIDRALTARLLGFSRPAPNSLDGVSDRDFCVELCAALSLVMTHLSRFCEEIIMWCSWEFRFVELDDRFSTGSSIMPQKKNPDIAELIRGKTGRVNGSLITLLTMLKGTPLAYNKDMQEDKEAVFDAVDTVLHSLSAFTPMVQTMRVHPENMRSAAAAGFINATDCADYLTKKGVPFRDAYKITGLLVAKCIETHKTLETLEIEHYKALCESFESDVYEAIRLETCLSGRNVYGGPAEDTVKGQIEELRAALLASEG